MPSPKNGHRYSVRGEEHRLQNPELVTRILCSKVMPPLGNGVCLSDPRLLPYNLDHLGLAEIALSTSLQVIGHDAAKARLQDAKIHQQHAQMLASLNDKVRILPPGRLKQKSPLALCMNASVQKSESLRD